MTSKYSIETWNDEHTIRIRNDDGYVSLTDMAQATGKQYNHYMSTNSSKEYLQQLSLITGITGIKLIDQKSKKTGTWAHPHVAIHFAMWCNPQFAVWAVQLIHAAMEGKLELSLWRNVRQDGKLIRQSFTQFLQEECGYQKWYDFARITDQGYEQLFGLKAKQMKEVWEHVDGATTIARNHVPETVGLDMIKFYEQMVPLEYKFNGGNLQEAIHQGVRKTLHQYRKSLPPAASHLLHCQ